MELAIWLLLHKNRNHVPCPASGLGAVNILHLRPKSELVTVLVGPLRLLIIQFERRDAEIGQRVKLSGLRYAVVVRVLPESERCEDLIPSGDHAVSVPALRGLVELRERQESVRRRLIAE